MIAQARLVIEEGRRKIAALEERIRQHPYLQALETRQVDRAKLAIFAGAFLVNLEAWGANCGRMKGGSHASE